MIVVLLHADGFYVTIHNVQNVRYIHQDSRGLSVIATQTFGNDEVMHTNVLDIRVSLR